MNNQTSTATNLQGPDIATSTEANKYFNNLYALPFNVSAEVNDALNAYFETYTGNKISGDNLAAVVLYTALAQNLNPLSVLQQFQSLPKGEINTYLTAFLNVTRVPTSLLGFKTGTTTNQFVQRSILP